MRLPFLQVVIDDSRRHGRQLALLDPHKRDQHWWRGLLLDIWDCGLQASGDKRPDGRIKGARALEFLASSIGYSGPPAELGQLLVDADLAEISASGLRVKGVAELYGPSWDKKNRDVANGVKGAKTRWSDRGAIGGAIPFPHSKKEKEKETEKKTEKEKEKKTEEDLFRPSADQQAQEEKKQRAKSLQEEVFEEIQLTRADKMRELGIDAAPDEALSPGFVNTALKRISDKTGEKCTIAAQLFDLYLAEPWAAEKSPPFAFRVFASDKVWPKLLERMGAA